MQNLVGIVFVTLLYKSIWLYVCRLRLLNLEVTILIFVYCFALLNREIDSLHSILGSINATQVISLLKYNFWVLPFGLIMKILPRRII